MNLLAVISQSSPWYPLALLLVVAILVAVLWRWAIPAMNLSEGVSFPIKALLVIVLIVFIANFLWALVDEPFLRF